jgi:hypothetical protein
MHPYAHLYMAETEARHWWFDGRRAILVLIIGAFNLPAYSKWLK